MEKTLAPTTKTTPNQGDSSPADFDEKVFIAQQAFLIGALHMSWQLAIVVLVPVLGGNWLDDRLDLAPWLTITGFAVATVGVVAILKRQLQRVSPVLPKDGK